MTDKEMKAMWDDIYEWTRAIKYIHASEAGQGPTSLLDLQFSVLLLDLHRRLEILEMDE